MSNEVAQFSELKANITLFVAPLRSIAVTDAVSGQKVIDALKQVKGYLKQIDEKKRLLLQPLTQQVTAIRDYASGLEAPLLDVERQAKAHLVAYEEIQEKKRAEAHRKEQERLREIQRQADAERARVDALAVERAAAERLALASVQESQDLFGCEDALAAEAERVALLERQSREQEARQAELDRQEAVRAGEARARAFDIESTRLKGTKKVWKCEAIDLSQVPPAFLIVQLNTAAVLAAARGGTTQIPGVKLWQESQVSIGANTSLKKLT
jgi:hypothetical protein